MFLMYLHVARGIFYGVKSSRTWFRGVAIFFLLLAVAATGYILPISNLSVALLSILVSFFKMYAPKGEVIAEFIHVTFEGLRDTCIRSKALRAILGCHLILAGLLGTSLFAHFTLLHSRGSKQASEGDKPSLAPFNPGYSM